MWDCECRGCVIEAKDLMRFQLALGNIMRQQMDSWPADPKMVGEDLVGLLQLSPGLPTFQGCRGHVELCLWQDGLKTRERSKEERQKEREEKKKKKAGKSTYGWLAALSIFSLVTSIS